MVDEKNHLFGPLDMLRDGKIVNKRKTQQQFSRFSTSLATISSNASIAGQSPAIQTNYNPQIGNPYDDSIGSISADIAISFQTYGSQYTFLEVTNDLEITFKDLPTGRFIEFSLQIKVNQPSGVTITFPQVTNPPLLEGLDGDEYVLKFVGVLRSDETGVNAPVETYTFLAGAEAGGGTGNLQLHVDLGDVSGNVEVNWTLGTLFTMVMTGDVDVQFTNVPASPNWQDICIQVQQDGVGGHDFSFNQVMANAFIPVPFSGGNRYTSFQIYTYQSPAGSQFFQGFNKGTSGSGGGVIIPGSSGDFNGFAGYCQAKLSVPQVGSLSPGNHIEFDTIIKNETVELAGNVGVGNQSAGVFQGLTVGHTFECVCYLSVFGLPSLIANMTVQWFDRAGNNLIGTQARSFVLDDPAATNQQIVATAYFTPTNVADSLHVQITDTFNVVGIHAGGFPGTGIEDPVCFATVKDCGVTESIINGTQPAPEDISLDIREMTYLRVAVNSPASRFSSWQGNLQNTAVPSDTKVSQAGVIKSLFIVVSQKGAGVISFNFRKNGIQFGPTFQLPASTTGVFEFPGTDLQFDRGDLIGWETSGGVGGQPTGDQWNMTMIMWWI